MRRFVVAMCLLSTFAGFAAEPLTPQVTAPKDRFAQSLPSIPEADRKVVMRAEKAQSDVLMFKYALPAGAVEGATLTATIRLGQRTIVSETIEMPAELHGDTATIAVLPYHQQELEKIRKMEAGRPGELRFRVAAGDDVIADVRFIDAVAAGAKLQAAPTVGQTRTVDVRLPQPKKAAVNGVYPDPACEAECNAVYVECYYEICDQRGDCSYCWEDYERCADSCPQICEEPKSVRTFTHWGYVGSVNYGIHCMLNAYYNQNFYYQLWQDVYATQQIRRTEHCNGTYTDEVLSTTYSYSYCYEKLIPSSWCIHAEGVVPLNAEC